MKIKEPEKNLTKKVLAYLKTVPECEAIRIVPGPYGGMKGVGDVLCCYRGLFVAIELKSATGRLSALQERFLGNVRNAHGQTFVCRSLQDVKDALDNVNTWAMVPLS
jgi:hypothetical protein